MNSRYQTLTYFKAGDTIWSDTTNLSEGLNKIELIKIDVQGYEEKVLEGAINSLEIIGSMVRRCCLY